MQKLYLFLAFVLILSTGSAQHFEMRFTKITDKNGQSPGPTFAIAEDEMGFIWFGTLNGLLRYDGSNFKHYKHNRNNHNSLSNNTIRSLHFDKDGFLWIGTQGGGLNRFDRKTETFISYRHDANDDNTISNDDIWSICEDSDGNLWLGTWGGGVNKFDKNKKMFTRYLNEPNTNNSLSGNIVRSILMDSKGAIWIGTEDKGLNKLNPKTGQIKRYTNNPKNKNSISSNNIYGILENNKNQILLCTFGGSLNIYNREKDNFSKFPKKTGLDSSFYRISERQDGTYWIAHEEGIYLANLEEDTFKPFVHDQCNLNSLSTNRTRCIYEDRNGITWIGTENGVDKIIEKNNFLLYKHDIKNNNSLPSNTVRSIFEDKNGLLWIGFLDAALSTYDKKTNSYSLYKPTKENPNIPDISGVSSIMEDKTGNLWFGTWGNGLINFNRETNKTTKYYSTDSQLCDNRIQAIKTGNLNDIWIATENGLNRFDYQSNEWMTFQHNPDDNNSLSGNSTQANALIIEKSGTIWVGTWANGLNKFTPDLTGNNKHQCTHYKNKVGVSNCLSNNNVISLHKDKKGILWIGTFGGGLNRFDPVSKVFTNWSEDAGLPNNTIFGILEDENGNLWLSTDDGLSCFNPKDETFKNFKENDGLQGDHFYWGSSFQSPSGEMFFGGTNGMNSFYPEKIKKNQHLPPVVLTKLKQNNSEVIFGKSMPYITDILLAYNKNQFIIEFAGLDYIEPAKNQSAYMLEGLDDDWTYNENFNFANYTNIPPGTYIFKVKAANNDGVWNEEGTSIKITVLPPWWQTWWFRSLAVIIVVGSGFSFYLIRMNQMKKRQKVLERKVKERTNDLQEANIILEESREEIYQQNEALEGKHLEILEAYEIVERQNKSIKDSIRYAETIQQAILPAKVNINKALNNFVIFRPKDIVSGDFYWMTTITNEHKPTENCTIVAVVDCTGHGVPGAFMSMVGSSLLKEIINQKKIYDPSEILKQLNIGVKEALKQNITENDDGMDVCLCKIKTQSPTSVITFSGAKRPLYYYNSKTNDLQRFKGCLNSIGGRYYLKEFPYENIELNAKSGDMIYLTSDGFIDQNNDKRKSFGKIAFNALLTTNAKLPIDQQHQKIEQALDEYMKSEKQRDDITVIGIRF